MKKKPKIKKLPKYNFGGDTKDILENYGRGVADTALTMVGAGNVIQDDAYKGKGSQFMRGYSNIIGGVGKAVLPIAANIIAPGIGGNVASGIQTVGSSFNPESNQAIDPRTGLPYGQTSKAIGQGAGSVSATVGQQMFPMGGVSQIPNAEVEMQENSITPTGEFTQYNGASHEQGGIPVNMEPGERIYSDRLKVPGTKKTFAELNKKNNTTKQDKVLENNKSTGVSKISAELIKSIKQKKSDQLFQEQEMLKQSKVQAYAKKMGLDIGNTFAMGGTKKYWAGGTEEGEPIGPFGSNNERGNMLAPDNTGVNNPMYTQEDLDRLKSFNNSMTNNQILNQNSKPIVGISQTLRQQELNEVVPKSSYNNISNPNTQGHDIENPSNIPNNPNQPRDWRTPAGAAFSGLVQSADELLYLKEQGKNYDKVDYGTVTPNQVNYSEAERSAEREAYTSRKTLNNIGNSGNLKSNLVGLYANRAQKIAQINQEESNVNTQINNQAKYANQGYKMQGMVDEAQNKGQALTNYYQAIGEIGNNTAGAFKDYKSGKMDMNTAKMLSSMFTNFGLDMNNPNDWSIYYKKLQEQKGAIPENPTTYKRKSGSFSSNQTK